MLKKLLKDFNLTDEQISNLDRLREVVLEYNEHTNLTSITAVEEFNVKHIFDSLSILSFYELIDKKILDVGSGGGFPGLAIAIAVPTAHVTMLDSNNKKVQFIDHAIKELGINNASTIHARVEEADLTEKFDIVVSRAVAALNILLEITAFAAKIDGQLIYYKGSNASLELSEDWTKVKKLLGIELTSDNTFELDSNTERRLVGFTKVSKTHNEYPRIYSQIKKNPIY